MDWWPDDSGEIIPIYITGSNEPYAFGFSGFNEADRLKYLPEVPMAEIEAALEKDGFYQHPTRAIRIGRTRDF